MVIWYKIVKTLGYVFLISICIFTQIYAYSYKVQTNVLKQELTTKEQQLALANTKYVEASEKLNSIELRTMELTAYTHTGNLTKTGVKPSRGMIAVDPKVIPLGSDVFIEGIGWVKATDTGGDIKGNRIDLFLDTEQECVLFGRQKRNVYIKK